ncbi:MAG: glycosyltransferase family 4 protein [Granulosicoccus sp.]
MKNNHLQVDGTQSGGGLLRNDRQSVSVLLVSSIDISLLRFRGRLIERLIEEEFRVVVAAPEYKEPTRLSLEALGAETRQFPLNRTGMNPAKDWAARNALRKIMVDDDINLVFSYNAKPVIYASLAAASLSLPSISLITGLGYGFSGDTLKARFIGKLMTVLYRRALKNNSAVIFQNNDDRGLFESLSLVPATASVSVVDGSGVDLNEFQWREPRGQTQLRFMFAGRLIKEKGVSLFIEAAAQLKADFEDAEFFVLGDPQPGSPSSIDLDRLRQLHDAGIVTHHLRRTDIAQFLAGCDVFVLPSFYREGVPRSILEALSTGLAVITSDGPGCRETVTHGENGLLVTPKDQAGLTSAMRSLLEKPETVVAMGHAGRHLAETRFDVNKVNDDVVAVVKDVVRTT